MLARERRGGGGSVTKQRLEGLRISVRLDAGLPVEALIMKRLVALPKRRHQDWIRALLVQGFVGRLVVDTQQRRWLFDGPFQPPPAGKHGRQC